MWIEIFKTGRHTSSNGNELDFSAEDLDKIAHQYNLRSTESPSMQAPLVKGHPHNDEPAQGWIERLARRGNFLMAKLRDLTPQIIDEVRNKQYQRISIALTNDLQLKHVGLLGAVSPAVEDLLPVSFAEFDETTQFEYSHTDDSITHLIHQNNELKDKVHTYQRTLVSRDLMEFCSNLVNNKVIPPNQQKSAVELLELAYVIDNSGNYEFQLLDKLKSFFNKLQYQSLQKEFAANHTINPIGKLGDNKSLLENRNELHKAVLEYMEQNPALNYQQALTNIIS